MAKSPSEVLTKYKPKKGDDTKEDNTKETKESKKSSKSNGLLDFIAKHKNSNK